MLVSVLKCSWMLPDVLIYGQMPSLNSREVEFIFVPLMRERYSCLDTVRKREFFSQTGVQRFGRYFEQLLIGYREG